MPRACALSPRTTGLHVFVCPAVPAGLASMQLLRVLDVSWNMLPQGSLANISISGAVLQQLAVEHNNPSSAVSPLGWCTDGMHQQCSWLTWRLLPLPAAGPLQPDSCSPCHLYVQQCVIPPKNMRTGHTRLAGLQGGCCGAQLHNRPPRVRHL